MLTLKSKMYDQQGRRWRVSSLDLGGCRGYEASLAYTAIDRAAEIDPTAVVAEARITVTNAAGVQTTLTVELAAAFDEAATETAQ